MNADTINIFGWVSAGLSMTGLYLNARKIVYCWYVWIGSNITWQIYYIHRKDFPAMVLWLAFLFFNIYGLIKWTKDEKNIRAKSLK